MPRTFLTAQLMRPAGAVLLACALTVVPTLGAQAQTRLLETPGASHQTLKAAALRASGRLGGDRLRPELGNRAQVVQRGHNNSATVHQSGDGNRVIVRQIGSGHSTDVSQTNGGNTAFVLQIGSGTHVDVNQTGGQSGRYIAIGH